MRQLDPFVEVKGVISGAGVTVTDAQGSVIAEGATTTDENGRFSVSFSRDTEIVTPLQFTVSGGEGVEMLCDVMPACENGVDGSGDPGTGRDYREALEALYPVSYKLKFMSRNGQNRDYVVPPQEALWWADDMNTFITREKSAWKWTNPSMDSCS